MTRRPNTRLIEPFWKTFAAEFASRCDDAQRLTFTARTKLYHDVRDQLACHFPYRSDPKYLRELARLLMSHLKYKRGSQWRA